MKKGAWLLLTLLFFVSAPVSAEDFVRKHDSRLSFSIAHETLVSRLEYQKILFTMAKEGSMKRRRILCFQIPAIMKDLYDINVLNKEWQSEEELERSEKHLEILMRKRKEILSSTNCQGS